MSTVWPHDRQVIKDSPLPSTIVTCMPSALSLVGRLNEVEPMVTDVPPLRHTGHEQHGLWTAASNRSHTPFGQTAHG
ncbi:hypothetical protein [Streptomyces sp. NPDC047097]|uniref:hypothetical protein n=1 Tax=Streptomyces sp. NPDC047097 TaxID=3155260 RepID=UPI0033CAF37A